MALVLVDSSVWIDYFRNGNDQLEELITEDIVCTNDLILTELLPSLSFIKNKQLLDGMLALNRLELRIDWGILRKYQTINLKNGINKVGIPDLIILEQVIHQHLTLFSIDKHFKIMQSQFQFDMIGL
jgi:predicted nucleic acid-binding protein